MPLLLNFHMQLPSARVPKLTSPNSQNTFAQSNFDAVRKRPQTTVRIVEAAGDLSPQCSQSFAVTTSNSKRYATATRPAQPHKSSAASRVEHCYTVAKCNFSSTRCESLLRIANPVELHDELCDLSPILAARMQARDQLVTSTSFGNDDVYFTSATRRPFPVISSNFRVLVAGATSTRARDPLAPAQCGHCVHCYRTK